MSDGSSMFIVYVLELLRWAGDNTTLSLYYPTVKKAAQWQMDVSKPLGVPERLETTYDILGFPHYQLSAYASAFHLIAMRASSALATAAGDDAFAATCDAAFERAQAAMDALQWNATAGHYNAASDGCTATGCATGIGLFADSFYAQVLAYSLGLGELLPDPRRLDAHLAATVARNCVHTDVASGELRAGCENGLVIMSGRPLQPSGQTTASDLQVWEMATYDTVTLQLHRGASWPGALQLAEGTGTSYAQRLHDQWNVAGIKDTQGYPTITSHYGYHMVSWHLLFAASGQAARLDHPHGPRLSFAPKPTCAGTGFALPVLLPGCAGTLRCTPAAPPDSTLESAAVELTLDLATGAPLHLAQLSVGGAEHGPVVVAQGAPARWRASGSAAHALLHQA